MPAGPSLVLVMVAIVVVATRGSHLAFTVQLEAASAAGVCLSAIDVWRASPAHREMEVNGRADSVDTAGATCPWQASQLVRSVAEAGQRGVRFDTAVTTAATASKGVSPHHGLWSGTQILRVWAVRDDAEARVLRAGAWWRWVQWRKLRDRAERRLTAAFIGTEDVSLAVGLLDVGAVSVCGTRMARGQFGGLVQGLRNWYSGRVSDACVVMDGRLYGTRLLQPSASCGGCVPSACWRACGT
jgi:hypothetical protein